MDPIFNILDLSTHTRNCSKNEKKCGNNRGFMVCIPKEIDCPINDIKIVPYNET